ncbi:unnamed protein product [Calicophoron daubneyi]|uniref:Origin recognition complex subunit 5 n=1 Tax=Calicophoron daubneyi TaxID=300641 RepID=A0AAV2T4H6_CALDB
MTLMHSWKCVQRPSFPVIGREKECKFLMSLVGDNNPLTPCIIINGPSGCGKSHLVSSTFSELERINGQKWVLVSCLESCCSASTSTVSSKLLFHLVLQAIKLRYLPNAKMNFHSCDGAADFLESLCELLMHIGKNAKGTRVCLALIFDQAEKIRDADPLLLPFLVRLGSLVSEQRNRGMAGPLSQFINVMTILITKSPWEKFSSGTFHLEPTVISCSSYSREQMANILTSYSPADASQSRFSRFVDLLLTICFPVCRNARELIHLMKFNWPAFEDPVIKGVVGPDDEWGQWKLAQPTLKRSLTTLYLRPQAATDNLLAVTQQQQTVSVALELPYFTRYLLIAAYMASYNSRAADKKFLVKNTGKQSSRKKRQEKKAEKTSTLLTGPRVFQLDRLLAIFQALTQNESIQAPMSCLLLSQIACLVGLGLLAATSADNAVGGLHTAGLGTLFPRSVSHVDTDPLAGPRYRCLLNLETAKAVAQSVEFDLPAYLTDFCGV